VIKINYNEREIPPEKQKIPPKKPKKNSKKRAEI
jgi:hypothetical protein